MMHFALKMMHFVLKLMNFALKMMNFALKMVKLSLKMMKFVFENDEGGVAIRAHGRRGHSFHHFLSSFLIIIFNAKFTHL